jgi:hypothetical protein
MFCFSFNGECTDPLGVGGVIGGLYLSFSSEDGDGVDLVDDE